MEPIFTDKEVREVLEMHNLSYRHHKDNETIRHTNKDGDENLYYKLAKAVRDAVEEKLTSCSGKEQSNRVIIMKLTGEII